MTEHIPKPETSPPIDLLTKTIRLEALKLGFTKVGFSQIDQIKKNSGLLSLGPQISLKEKRRYVKHGARTH